MYPITQIVGYIINSKLERMSEEEIMAKFEVDGLMEIAETTSRTQSSNTTGQ